MVNFVKNVPLGLIISLENVLLFYPNHEILNRDSEIVTDYLFF